VSFKRGRSLATCEAGTNDGQVAKQQGKGLQNLYTWVQFPPWPPYVAEPSGYRQKLVCPGGGMADTKDLKSFEATRAGSTPAPGTFLQTRVSKTKSPPTGLFVLYFVLILLKFYSRTSISVFFIPKILASLVLSNQTSKRLVLHFWCILSSTTNILSP
jgi:hypothetical protein